MWTVLLNSWRAQATLSWKAIKEHAISIKIYSHTWTGKVTEDEELLDKPLISEFHRKRNWLLTTFTSRAFFNLITGKEEYEL